MRSELPFFLLKGDAQTGPFTLTQLRSMWGHGAITADTFYWQEGEAEWLPISALLDELEQTSSRALVPSVGFSGDRDRPPPIPVSRRTCLFCAEPIADTAMKCRHCGETLDPRLRAAEEASKAAALVAAAPKFRPRNANACPVCAGAVAPYERACPQCGHTLKLGCLSKLGIVACALIALCVLLVIIGQALSPSEGQHPSDEDSNPSSSERTPSRPEPMPSTAASPGPTMSFPSHVNETAFISLIQSYASRYSSAPNELKKTTVRMERRESLAALVADMQVSQWTGTLKKMSTNQQGDASIEIELDGDPPITLRTDINPFDDTLIAYGSRLYNNLSALSVGEKVIFSGNFLPSEQDHIKEASLTELGAMGEPEFVMRFSDVTAASALATPSPSPESSPEPVPSPADSQAPTTSSSLESAPQNPTPSALATTSPLPEASPPPLLARPSPAPQASPEPVSSAAASPAPTLPVGEAPSATSTEHTSCSVVGVPEGDLLNVHSEPNAKSQVVAKLPNGYPDVQVVGRPVMNSKTEWVEIKFGDGTGWVTTKYLSARAAQATPDARDGPWVARVRALNVSNARSAGFSDGIQVVTDLVVKFSYAGDDEYAMRGHLADAKSSALSAFDQLAEKHGLDHDVFNAYRQGWSEGFDRNASSLSVRINP